MQNCSGPHSAQQGKAGRHNIQRPICLKITRFYNGTWQECEISVKDFYMVFHCLFWYFSLRTVIDLIGRFCVYFCLKTSYKPLIPKSMTQGEKRNQRHTVKAPVLAMQILCSTLWCWFAVLHANPQPLEGGEFHLSLQVQNDDRVRIFSAYCSFGQAGIWEGIWSCQFHFSLNTALEL